MHILHKNCIYKEFYNILIFCVFMFIFILLSGAGFARDYEKNDQFGHFVRMISALPFAPPDRLDEVFHLPTHRIPCNVRDANFPKIVGEPPPQKKQKKYVHSFLRGGPNRKGIKRCSSSSSCTEKISLMHFNNFEIVWGQICHISNSSIYQWLRSFNCCVTRLLSCVTRHPSSRQRNSVSSV